AAAVRALYEQTIAFILQYVDENRLQEGDQLPTETKLAVQAGVSLVTVRRAVAEPAAQGGGRRGAGTRHVRRPAPRASRDDQSRRSAQQPAPRCAIQAAIPHSQLLPKAGQ